MFAPCLSQFARPWAVVALLSAGCALSHDMAVPVPDRGEGNQEPQDGRPIGLAATMDLEGWVTLRFLPGKTPDGRQPDGFVIFRDEAVIAELPASARSFDDLLAEPGVIGAPSGLDASDATRADGVWLQFEAPPSEPGSLHSYRVQSLLGGQLGPSTHTVPGRRAAPRVLHYELCTEPCRDWRPMGAETQFLDTEAARCTLQVGRATAQAQLAGGGAVMLADEESSLEPAAEALYRVRAQTVGGPGPASAPDPGVRSLGFLRYQWQRSPDGPFAAFEDLPGVTGHAWFDASPPLDQWFQYRARVSADCAERSDVTAIATVRTAKPLAAWVDGSTRCGATRSGELFCEGGVPEGAPSEALTSLTMGGRGFLCGLTVGEGQLACWGNQAPRIEGAERYVLASAGEYQVCAIRADDGHVACFDSTGERASPLPEVAFSHISADDTYLCGVRAENGMLECSRDVPVKQSVQSVNGVGNGCALSTSERATCWAYHPNTPWVSDEPIQTISDIPCGLTPDGRVSCWGKYQTVRVPEGNRYRDIEGSCVLDREGRATCFPLGSYLRQSLPIAWEVAETNSAYALDGEGRVHCHAHGSACEAPAGSGFHQLVGNVSLSCVLDREEQVVCFGTQRDAGLAPPRNEPMRAIAFSEGREPESPTVCGIRKRDGGVECWGRVSRALNDVERWSAGLALKQLAVGFHHVCGLDSAGQLHCLAGDGAGRATPIQRDVRYRSLCAESTQTCAIELDSGALACWGVFNDGRVRIDDAAYSQLACMDGQVCAIRSADQRLVCWDGSVEPTLLSVDAYAQVAPACAVRASDHKLVCLHAAAARTVSGDLLVTP